MEEWERLGCDNNMETKIYHAVKTAPKSNRKFVDSGHTLGLVETLHWIISGGVQLVIWGHE